MTKTRIDFEWERGKSPTAFAAKLALFEKLLDNELEEAMDASVLLVEREAKLRAPVGETGNLKASIKSQVKRIANDTIRGYIGSNVEYAPYQEFGTSIMDAQPYLRPAIDAAEPRIRANFRTAVDRAAIGAGVS